MTERYADIIEFSPVGTLFEIEWSGSFAHLHEMYVKTGENDAILIEGKMKDGEWESYREHYDIEYLLQQAVSGRVVHVIDHGMWAGEIDFGITFPGEK